MKYILISSILSATLLFIFSSLSKAQSPSEEIEEVKRQIEEIQRQHQKQIDQLIKRIEELEAQAETEQKEIKESIVKEETESEDEWYKKFKVGYDEGLFAETADGNFKITMRILGQFQLSVNEADKRDTATNFEVRRFRIKWDGNAFRPWFLYTVQIGDDGDGFELIDAYLTAAFITRYGDVITPRVGQFKVPFTREALINATDLQFVDRSIVNDEFGLDRERGTALYGVLGNYITYGGGVFNGARRNGRTTDSNLLYAGRIQVTPCCGRLNYDGNSQFPSGGSYNYVPQNFNQRYKPTFAIAGAVWGIPGLNTDKKSPSPAITERFNEIFSAAGVEPVADIVALTADVSFKYWLLSLEGAYDARWIRPKDIDPGSVFDQGFTVQGGIFFWPDIVELAARYALIHYDSDIRGRDKRWAITPGFNLYLTRDNRWKLQFDYSFIKDQDATGDKVDQNEVRAQLQAFF